MVNSNKIVTFSQKTTEQIQQAKTKIEIVWFKRDLRTVDHQPLTHACNAALSNGHSLLPIFIIEEPLWLSEDASYRHWHFIHQSLLDLNKSLITMGQPLIVLQGDAEEVLTKLADEFEVFRIWSHQETGNMASFKRDLKVKAFCQQNQIDWFEYPQQAIKRAGLDRDHYQDISRAFFEQPIFETPAFQQISAINISWAVQNFDENYQNPYVDQSTRYEHEKTQRGGRYNGLSLLNSFSQNRHKKYLANISKPLGGDIFSSRLSPHLAFGTLSTREVMLFIEQNKKRLPNQSAHLKGLRVFQQRLYWQSHFMQKLESEPSIEHLSMHPAYENIREWDETAKKHYQAWSTGQTGYPMVDACMRCLIETGWLPFRMRALLVSFASYQLWIPWQKTAIHLARLFTDYEPGIHYSQVQMQSGTTGINSIRIYNPVKQSLEHDKNGAFIRKWCPELKALDNNAIHSPWKQDLINKAVDYPDPIVDLEESTERAKDRIYGIKNELENKVISQKVFLKHGSRSSNEFRKRSQNKKTRGKKVSKTQTVNMEFKQKQMPLF